MGRRDEADLRDNPSTSPPACPVRSVSLRDDQRLLNATAGSMFSWVIRVVPQPPVPPGKLGEDDNSNASTTPVANVLRKDEAKKESDPSKKVGEDQEENSSQNGVLSWLSYGFSSALPQPVTFDSKQEGNAVSNSVASDQTGMMGWLVQGLGKVVPQPDEKYMGHTESEEVTEVQDIRHMPDPEPLPEIPVVEIESDEEMESPNTPFSPMVIEWIKQGFEKVVPQSPLHLHPPASSEATVQRPASAPATPYKKELAPSPIPSPVPARSPAPAPPRAPATPAAAPPATPALQTPKAPEDSKGTNMVGWIVQGFGRMIPQPVLKSKADASDVVQNGERVSKAP